MQTKISIKHPRLFHKKHGGTRISKLLAALFLTLPLSATAQPPAAANALTQQVIKSGMLGCAGRVSQVSSYLSNNTQMGAVIFTPPAQAANRLFSVSMGLAAKGAPPAYASMNFAPNQANGCGAAYDVVAYWPQRCETVAKQYFKGFQSRQTLPQNIRVLENRSTIRVFLMPAGKKGCVSIKKEVVL